MLTLGIMIKQNAITTKTINTANRMIKQKILTAKTINTINHMIKKKILITETINTINLMIKQNILTTKIINAINHMIVHLQLTEIANILIIMTEIKGKLKRSLTLSLQRILLAHLINLMAEVS